MNPIRYRAQIGCALTACLAVACAGSLPPPTPVYSMDCSQRAFDASNLEEHVKPSVLRVYAISDGEVQATGTGFVLTHELGRQETLVVTNYHVVHPGEEFAVDMQTGSDEPLHIGRVEVVKVDRVHDLAILRVPANLANAQGLSINPLEPRMGQRWAALGYPGGTADAPMTFESGEVTASRRRVAAQDYVQTNINLNPGNSGGPVIDACGMVSGVASAVIEGVHGMALVIPAARIAALYKSYREPRPQANQEIETKMQAFFRAMEYEDSSSAVNYLSRAYLLNVGGPVLKEFAEHALARLQWVRSKVTEAGYDFDNLDEGTQTQLIAKYLQPEELTALALALRIRRNELDGYEALTQFAPLYMYEQFGHVAAHRIETVDMADDKHAEVSVRLDTNNNTDRYVLRVVREWGDWAIEEVRVLGGGRSQGSAPRADQTAPVSEEEQATVDSPSMPAIEVVRSRPAGAQGARP